MTDFSDFDDLKIGCRLMLDFFAKQPGDQSNARELLEAFLEKVLCYLDNHLPVEEITFNSTDMFNLVWNEPTTSEQARKKINSSRTTLKTKLDNWLPELQAYLNNNGTDFYIDIAEIESIGGAKQRKLYYPKVVRFNVDSETNTATPNKSHIVYRVTQQNKVPFWAKWLNSFDITRGRRKYFFQSIPIGTFLLLAYFAAGISYGWFTNLSISLLAPLLFIAIVLSWISYYLFKLVDDGIVKAPEILTHFKQYNAHLTLHHHTESNERTRTIKLASYIGECPICNARVYIVKDNKEFFGRYVGKCAQAPLEHIFSFDHVTKQGQFLR